MAYLAVNRDGEELVFNDCPIYDRVEDTWKIPMLRWELVYDDPDDHSAGVHEDEVRDMAGGSGAGSRRAMDASRRGTGVFLWIDRG